MGQKACPMCAEEVEEQDPYCKYCGHDLSRPEQTAPPAHAHTVQRPSLRGRRGSFVVAGIVLCLILGVGGYFYSMQEEERQRCVKWKGTVAQVYENSLGYLPNFSFGPSVHDYAEVELQELYGEEWQAYDSNAFPVGESFTVPHPPSAECEEEFFRERR